jgi:DedD protein
MALFKMRKGGDESQATPRPESIEAMRRRARHRLIGAAVLVLIGVLGFPLLFDTQPRPIAVDIPIEIPDRNKVKPLAVPPPAGAQAPVVSGPVTAPPMTATPPAAVPEPPAQAPQAQAETKPESRPEPKPEPKSAAKPQAAPGDGAKALALLEGKPINAPAAADGRFVVQVGAFSDAAKARDVRRRVERAGLKTYTHVSETKDGKRIRVRVGPFGSRPEADRAANKIKGLDLPAAILTL